MELVRSSNAIPAAKKDNHNHRDNRKPRVKIVEDLDMVLGSTDRLGPDPEMVQKQIWVNKGDGVYAGSGFFASPPPSSLPVPGFLAKKGKGTAAVASTEALNFDGMEETELCW